MASTGTAVIDFGSGSASASVVVTGQSGITTGSLCEAFMQGATTADHSHDEHLVETISLRCGNLVAGTGFTIYAEILKGQSRGQFSVCWVWA